MPYIQNAGRALRINGFAALFNTPIVVDGKTEIIAPGAFTATLRRASAVRALVSHDPTTQWAGVADGSLRLWQDSAGLAFSAKIQDTTAGRQLARSVASGGAGASFRFRVLTETGETVKSAMLAEISIVGLPAYPTAAWLSDLALMDDMPGHAQALRRLWSEPGRDTAAALRAMASRAPRKPAARPHRAATSALSDAYPAGFGFSSAELGKLAMLDGAARRYNKAVAALRFERQRETNRARRNTRRAA